MAIAARVTIEEAAPIHVMIPPVSNLHKTVPVIPSGWVEDRLINTSGVINTAYRISATARFTSR